MNTYTDDVEWGQRIIEILASGMRDGEIAKAVGMSPQGLSDLKKGRRKEPCGMAAVRLYHLHRRCVGKMLREADPLRKDKAL